MHVYSFWKPSFPSNLTPNKNKNNFRSPIQNCQSEVIKTSPNKIPKSPLSPPTYDDASTWKLRGCFFLVLIFIPFVYVSFSSKVLCFRAWCDSANRWRCLYERCLATALRRSFRLCCHSKHSSRTLFWNVCIARCVVFPADIRMKPMMEMPEDIDVNDDPDRPKNTTFKKALMKRYCKYWRFFFEFQNNVWVTQTCLACRKPMIATLINIETRIEEALISFVTFVKIWD